MLINYKMSYCESSSDSYSDSYLEPSSSSSSDFNAYSEDGFETRVKYKDDYLDVNGYKFVYIQDSKPYIKTTTILSDFEDLYVYGIHGLINYRNSYELLYQLIRLNDSYTVFDKLIKFEYENGNQFIDEYKQKINEKYPDYKLEVQVYDINKYAIIWPTVLNIHFDYYSPFTKSFSLRFIEHITDSFIVMKFINGRLNLEVCLREEMIRPINRSLISRNIEFYKIPNEITKYISRINSRSGSGLVFKINSKLEKIIKIKNKDLNPLLRDKYPELINRIFEIIKLIIDTNIHKSYKFDLIYSDRTSTPICLLPFVHRDLNKINKNKDVKIYTAKSIIKFKYEKYTFRLRTPVAYRLDNEICNFGIFNEEENIDCNFSIMKNEEIDLEMKIRNNCEKK